MTIERLRCFVSAAKHLNFTRAAEELHIAQTAVSRQIASLEEELDCRLFVRNNRTTGLTIAGERFLEGIGPLLELYDKTVEQTRSVGKRLAGELHIGIGQYERDFVSELVREFHQSYPLVEVMVTQYRYSELLDHLLAGALDVVFALPVSAEYLAGQEGVEIQELFSSEVCIAVWEGHPMAHARLFPKERFAQERLLTISEEAGPCSMQNLMEKFSLSQVEFKEIRRANSLEAALLMVRAELGIAIIPEFLRDKVPDRVVTVPTKGWQMAWDRFVAVSRRGSKPSQVEAFWNGIACSNTLWEQMERFKER